MVALLALAGCEDETISLDIDAACQPGACQVDADYGELGALSGTADAIADQLVWAGMVDDECGARRVHLQIKLINGRGAFAAGIVPGTYGITGEELAPGTCGACIRLEVSAMCYFASGGTLSLTSTEVDLAGQLTGASFRPVSCVTDAPLTTDCESAIDSMSFRETIGGEG
jgi:hypothetical protein